MGDPPVVDFDHNSREFLGDRAEHWKTLRRTPVAFSPLYGGYWVVSGHAEVARVSRDEQTFSSVFDGEGLRGAIGIPRPQGIPPAGIAEAGPEVHQALRRVMNPFLLPPAVSALEPFMAEVTEWFVDRIIESGRADLTLDLANPVPAVVTMRLIGLPCDAWQHYGDLFHATVAYRASSTEYQSAIARVPEMLASLMAEAEDRRRRPRDDLLSALVHMEIAGRPLTDEQVGSVLWNLVGGGLDTTTSLTSLALFHMDADPDLRGRLIEDPAALAGATEEFLRYYSVNETLTRTVTRDTELGGQALKRGDVVLISWLSANHDESAFECPAEIRPDRLPNSHLAFGVGPHRCIGMHLARTLFQVLVTAVLNRMPDYRIDRDATRFYEGNPMLAGVVSMPASFTPAVPSGRVERPF
jgi:cytochrome P450